MGKWKIQMVSNPTKGKMNGKGARKCQSWIESFVEYTDNLESPVAFRRWCAISTLASVLERKVYVTTSAPLYPNLYTFIVGDAGIGKSRPINFSTTLLRQIDGIHLGATSMSMASMVDHMVEAKRTTIVPPHEAVEYRSLHLRADELSAFLNEYDKDLIPGLTTFYDCEPYSQGRRVGNIRIQIKQPQLNMLVGSTPSNLLKLVPEYAWEQGFTSRIFLIFADERPIIDALDPKYKKEAPEALIHDLKLIDKMAGEFAWSDEFAKQAWQWKQLGYPPQPTHPKLKHYNTRRFAHLLKLSMVANIDRTADLYLDVEDFNQAMTWMVAAEASMPMIFDKGAGSADSKAMDEILFFLRQYPEGVSEHKVVNFARNRIDNVHAVVKILELMQSGGLIRVIGFDPVTSLKLFIAINHDAPAATAKASPLPPQDKYR